MQQLTVSERSLAESCISVNLLFLSFISVRL